jgi:hypothetical protein
MLLEANGHLCERGYNMIIPLKKYDPNETLLKRKLFQKIQNNYNILGLITNILHN